MTQTIIANTIINFPFSEPTTPLPVCAIDLVTILLYSGAQTGGAR